MEIKSPLDALAAIRARCLPIAKDELAPCFPLASSIYALTTEGMRAGAAQGPYAAAVDQALAPLLLTPAQRVADQLLDLALDYRKDLSGRYEAGLYASKDAPAIRAALARMRQLLDPLQFPPAPTPEEVAANLREFAANPGYSHGDYADVMRRAADLLERVPK